MTSLLRFFILLLLVAMVRGANEGRKIYSFICRNPILVHIVAVACVLLILVLLYQLFCVPVNQCKKAPKPSKKDRDLELQHLGGSNNV